MKLQQVVFIFDDLPRTRYSYESIRITNMFLHNTRAITSLDYYNWSIGVIVDAFFFF